VFYSLLWKMGSIPSPAFHYAQTCRHSIVLKQRLWYSATLGGDTLFHEAIKGAWIAASSPLLAAPSSCCRG
jgi:hypothetical protein